VENESKNYYFGKKFLDLLNRNNIQQKTIIDNYEISDKTLDNFLHDRESKNISAEMRFRIIDAIYKAIAANTLKSQTSSIEPQDQSLVKLTKLFKSFPDELQNAALGNFETLELLNYQQQGKSRK